MTDTSKQIRSEITSDGNLKISLESVDKPEPKDGEVLIKIEASLLTLRFRPLLGPVMFQH